MSTDSAGNRYVAMLQTSKEEILLGDYWAKMMIGRFILKRPNLEISSGYRWVLDLLCNKKAVVAVVMNKDCWCQTLNKVLKLIFHCVVAQNIDLHISYVSFRENVADQAKRQGKFRHFVEWQCLVSGWVQFWSIFCLYHFVRFQRYDLEGCSFVSFHPVANIM